MSSDERHKMIAIRRVMNQTVRGHSAHSDKLIQIRNLIDKDTTSYERLDFELMFEEMIALALHLSTSPLATFETKANMRAILKTAHKRFTEEDWTVLISNTRKRLEKTGYILTTFNEIRNNIFDLIENPPYKIGAQNAEP